MQKRTAGEIILSAPSRKEEEHCSRNQSGYYLYLSKFFEDFMELSVEEKMNLLGHPANVADGDDSTDSRVYNRTPYNFGEVILLASRNWSQLSESIQEAWSTRATRLNSRPVPGLFLQVPDDINNNILLQSINSEWEVLVANLKHCIVQFQLTCKFWNFL